MGRATELAKEIEIYENALTYQEVKNDAQKKADIESKIKSLKMKLILSATADDNDDFSRRDQSDLSSIRTQLGEVPIFEGGSFELTNTFIARCQKVFDLCVKPNMKLEKEFLVGVKSRCSVHVTHRMGTSQKSWDELKKEIFSNFSGGITAIQSLQRALNTPYDRRKGFKKLATQISLNLEAARATLEKSLKKKEIKMEHGSSSNNGITVVPESLTIDKFMEHLGASIMATIIQVHHNELYNSMAPVWKKINDAGTLAEHAEYFQSQTGGGETTTYYGHRPHGQRGRSKNNAQPENYHKEEIAQIPLCRDFKNGNCFRGKNCRFRHEDKKAYLSEGQEEQSDDGSNYDSTEESREQTLFLTKCADGFDAECYASDVITNKNCTASAEKTQPLVGINIQSHSGTSASLKALIDTGSSITMISRKDVPRQLVGDVRKYDGKVAGIGSGRLTGYMDSRICIGKSKLRGVRIFIVENKMPMVIGRDVIFERNDVKCIPDAEGLRIIDKKAKKSEELVRYSTAVGKRKIRGRSTHKAQKHCRQTNTRHRDFKSSRDVRLNP